VQNIYDDYKFVTKQELEDLGLEHLEGTNLLKAYMHGFFVDMRLYQKALSSANPFTFEKYRKEKINKKIEESRPQRLQVKGDVPKVNKEVALKFMDIEDTGKKTKNPNLLHDERFKAMFQNPDFEVDKETEEYRLLKPLLVQLDKSKLKKLEKKYKNQEQQQKEDDAQSTDDDLFSENDDSSDDDNKWTKEVKKEYKKIQKEKKRHRDATPELKDNSVEMHDVDNFKLKELSKKISKASLGARVTKESSKPEVQMISGSAGNRQMVFSTEKKEGRGYQKRQEEMKKHREERKKIIRPITKLRKR